MHINFIDIFSSVFGLFLLIAVGYVITRYSILSLKATEFFSRFLLLVALPCSMFNSLQREYDPSFLIDIIWVLILGFIFVTLMLYLEKFAAKALRVDKAHQGVWVYAVAASNYGFMGFPLILTFFGETGLALAGVFCLPANIIFYSLGYLAIAKDVPENINTIAKEPLWKKLLLP